MFLNNKRALVSLLLLILYGLLQMHMLFKRVPPGHTDL